VTDQDGLKRCCADLYSSQAARLLLGESFHPGGPALTERLGEMLGLGARSRVLDVAAGRGAPAIHLARRFGCEVVGVELAAASVAAAGEAARAAALEGRVRFLLGDAERLPVEDACFDAVICECALCTFPDKARAAGEMARVLRAGGRVGVADLVRRGPLEGELRGLLAWVACVAGALPPDRYAAILEGAGLRVVELEAHDGALADMVDAIRTRLMAAQVAARLGRLELPGFDYEAARGMARAASKAITEGRLGYVLAVAASAA
jgi:ubiquinone/menaquinone biosynthesis C-methylase UbiE